MISPHDNGLLFEVDVADCQVLMEEFEGTAGPRGPLALLLAHDLLRSIKPRSVRFSSTINSLRDPRRHSPDLRSDLQTQLLQLARPFSSSKFGARCMPTSINAPLSPAV